MIIRNTFFSTLIIFFSLLASNTLAQDEKGKVHMETAKKLASLMHTERDYDVIIQAIANDTTNLFTQTNPDLKDEIKKSVEGVSETLSKRKENLREEINRIYTDFFTEDELKELLAFYTSPIGQKFLDSDAARSQRVSEATLAWGDLMSEEIVGLVRKDLQEKGYKF